MPASLEEMFQKQLNNPNETMGQQYSYLRDMGMVPKTSLEWMEPGHEGEYNNWGNSIRINSEAGSIQNAFSHELQHAVDQAHARHLTAISKQGNPTREQQQFVDALTKLDTPTPLSTGDLNSYRTARNERQAYGVANMNYKGGSYKGTPHMDATEATQQAILMDLAQRARKGNPSVKKEPQRDYVDETINNATDLIRSLFSRK